MIPPIISSARLLDLLNDGQPASDRIGRSTLYKWLMRDPKWRGCIVPTRGKKLWLSTQRLIDVGILRRPEEPRVLPMPALSLSYETRTVGA